MVTAIMLVVATAAVALAPQFPPSYRRQAADLTMETALSVIGLLACALVFSRLRRRPQLNEFMLACAIAVLALSNLFLVTVPVVAGWPPDDLTVWGAPVAGSFGALLFGLAAWVPNRPLRPSGPLLAAGAGGGTAAVMLTLVLVPAFARSLPPQAVAALAPGSARLNVLLRLVQLGLQLAMALLYGVAAVGFLRRFRQGREEFLGWLAVAAVLAVAAQVNYLLSAMNPQFLYGGNVLRCSFYAVLLLGSMRDIWSYWQALPKAAVLSRSGSGSPASYMTE